MNLKKIIPLLTVENPLEILKKVVAFNENISSGEMVTIQLMFSSGFSFKGIPVKINKEGNTIFISNNNGITYIDTKGIVSVEVLAFEGVMEILTEGKYFDVPADKIPTKLQLKRAVNTFNEKILDTYGVSIKSDVLLDDLGMDAEKYQFLQFLEHLKEALSAIALDVIGKEAMKSLKLISISSLSKSGISVNKNEQNLEIKVNFSDKFETEFKDKLKETIELYL